MSKKVYDLTKPEDLEEIYRLLEASDDDGATINNDEDFGEESDVAVEDNVEEREEGSETEQEVSDEDEENIEENSNFYLGKDKITKWYKKPRRSRVRRRPYNIITHLPGVIGEAKSAKTPVECWNFLFTDDILNDIVKYTNQYINTIKASFSRERDAKHTDMIEIRAFIGLLYLAGVYKANRLSLEELWGTDDDGIAKFGLVMNIKRFKFLIRCLRFDDRETRSARKEIDRLAPIRDVFTKFVNNCQVNYCIGENVTIDEMLPGFRGNCPFRQYIPSKPNKYGIKIFSLVDAKMFYSYNLEIYAGKQNEGAFSVSNKAPDVVKRLAEPLFGSGRNITADNWFTQLSLVNELKEKKLSYVGTIRKNRKELPTCFIRTKDREQYSSNFGFSSDGTTCVSYVPRKNKNVLLVSSLHEEQEIDVSTGEKQKPEIISFYNTTKIGVDIVDKMCGSYNVSRNIKRWPMVIFFTMLNIASINSQVIYVGNGFADLKRRMFIKHLANELVHDLLAQRRMKSIGIPVYLQQKLKRFGPTHEQHDYEPQIPPKRRRCETCTVETSKRRLSKYECKKCHIATCLSHAVFMCPRCYKREVEGQISSTESED